MQARMNAFKKVIGSWPIAMVIGLAMVVASTLPANAAQPVRFGYLVADQLHQYMVPIGLEKGYFKEEGVEIKPMNYSTAGIMMQALQSNDIDMGIVGVSDAMIAKASGTDVVIIATCNHAGSSLVVDPSINKFEDLSQPVGDPGSPPTTTRCWPCLKDSIIPM